jgi:hypothetical protein
MKESGRLHFQAVLSPRKEALVPSEHEAWWALSRSACDSEE